VKSVQRGYGGFLVTGPDAWISTASISPVDLTKSVLLIFGIGEANETGPKFQLTNEAILVELSKRGSGVVSFTWQVVEFY